MSSALSPLQGHQHDLSLGRTFQPVRASGTMPSILGLRTTQRTVQPQIPLWVRHQEKCKPTSLLLTECLTHGQIPSKKSEDRVLNECKLIREERSEASIKVSHCETLGIVFFFNWALKLYIQRDAHRWHRPVILTVGWLRREDLEF